MILDWNKVRFFVKPGATDMRKQINGLSLIVSEELQQDPFEGNLYLFCNKQKRILKIIYWDKNGFCLWQLCEASHNSHYAKHRVMRRRSGNLLRIEEDQTFLA